MQRVLVAPKLGHEGLRRMFLKRGKLIFFQVQSSCLFKPVSAVTVYISIDIPSCSITLLALKLGYVGPRRRQR